MPRSAPELGGTSELPPSATGSARRRRGTSGAGGGDALSPAPTERMPGCGRSIPVGLGCGMWTTLVARYRTGARRADLALVVVRRSMRRSKSCAQPSAQRTSRGHGCCSSAARELRFCSRSRCSLHAACVATSRRRDAASRGSARGGGSSGGSSGVESAAVALGGVLVGWALGIAVAAVAAEARRSAGRGRAARERALSRRARTAVADGSSPPRSSSGSPCRLPTREGARLGGGRPRRDRGAARDRRGARRWRGRRGATRTRTRDPRCSFSFYRGSSQSRRRSRVARVFPVLARWWGERKRVLARGAAGRGGARTWSGRCGRDGRFPDHRLRARAPRRGVPRDARPSRSRAGGVPGATGRRRARGSAEPRSGLRRRVDRRRFAELAGEGGAAHPVLRVTGGAGPRGARERRHRARPRPRRDRGEWVSGGRSGRQGVDCDGARGISSTPGQPVELRGIRPPDDEIVLRVAPSIVSFAAIVRLSGWLLPPHRARRSRATVGGGAAQAVATTTRCS